MTYVTELEGTTVTDSVKLGGFLLVGAFAHVLAFSATMILPLRALSEPDPNEDRPLIVVPRLEADQIVEIETFESEEAFLHRAKNEEGSTGNPNNAGANKRYAVKGPQDNPDPHLARQAALRDAAEFGMIGLLNSGAGGDPDAPTAPWGRDDSLGNDAKSARGNMWGDEIGDAFGAGGLGLTGIGEGGGGRGESIGLGTLGLGNIGTIGHGAGTGTGQGFGHGGGRLGGRHVAKPPSVRMGATSVSGRLPPEVIQRIVRQNFGRFRLCYESGLRKDPNLAGTVKVEFTIGSDGSVGKVSGGGSLPDAGVVACVTKAFYGLSFPQPEGGGKVVVSYPIAFAPGDGANSSASGSTSTSTSTSSSEKSLAETSTSDVKRALTEAGCSDVRGARVISAKKDGKSFTITFIPAGADALPQEEIARLTKDASVRRSGGAFLAIECEDKQAASALLARMPR